MITQERNNGRHVAGIIRTLGVVFLAIILKAHVVGTVSWQWAIIMITVLISLFVVDALVRSK